MGTRLVLVVSLLLTACHKDEKAVVRAVFRVKFITSQGDIVVEANKAWAPHGVDRLHEMVNMRYFDQRYFFRVVPGFIAQFGVNKDYDIHGRWCNYFIRDRPPKEQNLRGT